MSLLNFTLNRVIQKNFENVEKSKKYLRSSKNLAIKYQFCDIAVAAFGCFRRH